MKRALVVVESTESGTELLREAGEFAAAVDAELVLLGIRSEDDLEKDFEMLEKIGDIEGTAYGVETLENAVIGSVQEIADEALADLEVEYEVVGALADDGRADEILSTAAGRDCDHVFMTGRKRSPTGKAIFGDATQTVLLNFDGSVTVALE